MRTVALTGTGSCPSWSHMKMTRASKEDRKPLHRGVGTHLHVGLDGPYISTASLASAKSWRETFRLALQVALLRRAAHPRLFPDWPAGAGCSCAAPRCRMLFSPCLLGCSRTCSRVLGLSLGTAALFAAGANTVLLFPNWDVSYLLRGLIGRHALLGSGLWAGGLMVLVAATLISMMGWRGCCFRKSAPCCSILTALLAAGLALVGALICFVTSGVALRDGPLCMFNILSYNQTQAWKYGYPFKDLRHTNYLYDRSLWSSVCLEPSMAVVWHVSFFSVLLCISTLQLLLVAVHFINSFLGLFCSLCEE